MASPHAVRTPAHDRSRSGRRRSGLLVGATGLALTVTLLPGTAAAVPGEATTPEEAIRMVAEASHELEVVTEDLNTAEVLLEEQHAAAATAEQAAADAREQLSSLDDQIRLIARSAYTSDGLTHLDVLLTSDSVEDLVAQLGTLDAIADHSSDVLAEVARAADDADAARARAETAAAEAQDAVDAIAAEQADLEEQIADYEAQFEALTAEQQAQVVAAHTGEPVAAEAVQGAPAPVPAAAPAPAAPAPAAPAPAAPAPTAPAPTSAAQAAVAAALAQVGDAYVWGAGGPDAFDCSGLTQYAYSAAGIPLPHSSRMQAQLGAPVSAGDLQPGDLLFYYSPTSHVAMYIGNGQMVHASTSGSPVMVVAFDSMSGFTHARRVAG